MRKTRHAVLAAALIVVGACSGGDTTAPTSMTAGVADLAKGGSTASGERVTGNATIRLPLFDNVLEHYAVSAIRHRDGSVSGEFEEYSEQEGGQRIHATVVCFTVAGNAARLAARLDKSNVSFGPVGSYVIWSVIDNGNGAKAPPDETTDIYFGADERVAMYHCSIGAPLAPFYPSLRGNLQVESGL